MLLRIIVIQNETLTVQIETTLKYFMQFVSNYNCKMTFEVDLSLICCDSDSEVEAEIDIFFFSKR